MRILLIYPYCLEDRVNAEDAGVVPIGVYFVGAMLKAHHHDVEILNWHAIDRTPENIKAALREKKPVVIGFSVLNANRWGAIEIARIARQLDPSVGIVFGGIGATTLWRHFLTHFPDIDYVVTGEGEITFLELIQHLSEENAPGPEQIRGLAFRKNGQPFRTAPRPPLADLDTLPNPARYFTYRHVALTRGCPNRCTFCGSPGFWGKTVRFHSANYFVDQLETLYRQGQTFFYVSDDTFTLQKGRVVDVCRKIIGRQLPITWAAISRVDTVDEDVLLWMRKAGCIQISYGVESGSEKNRRLLNKQISAPQIKKAFGLTTEMGIMARAYFIYGCPGESRQSIQETLDLMDAISPLGAIFYILDIFPGTALYADYLKQSGATDDVWLNRIEDIMYYETDATLSREQVLAFGETLRSHFYTHLPGYVDAIALRDEKSLYPLHADFLSRLAMTFDAGDWSRIDAIAGKARVAEKLYLKALQYHPDPRAYLGLGILAQKRGDYAASMAVLSRGIARFPAHPQLNICLAVSAMNTGDMDTALIHLLKFQQLKETWPLIAGCYQALNAPEKAARFIVRDDGDG